MTPEAETAQPARGDRPVLYLVRHGETDWNLEPVRCQGWTDVPLNQRGREQAHELERAAGRSGEADPTAPHGGAEDESAASGTKPSAPPRLELRVDERLAETDRGEWESRVFADIVREDPEAWRAYREHPETFTFPGGESFAAQQRRVLTAVRDAALTRRVALLVTHGGSIRLVRAFLEGRGIEAFHEMKVPSGEVLEVDERSLARRIDAFLEPPAYPPGTG